ncbi:MAG TPA: tetratricopeptide repeat protein, partial [Pirellulales bacterium]
ARGEWLGVHSALTSGWIAAADVVRLDQAVDHFTARIRSHPADVAAYTSRGIAWRALGQYQRAIDDQNEAIRLDPKSAAAYANRGNAYAHLGRHDLAIPDYELAIRLDPELLAAHNNLAWSLATRPEREFRDAVLAVSSATKACQLTRWANPECLDTLAAAYAEAGDFEQATRWENQAIALSAPPGNAAFQARLALYQTKRPYRHLTINPQPVANVSR